MTEQRVNGLFQPLPGSRNAQHPISSTGPRHIAGIQTLTSPSRTEPFSAEERHLSFVNCPPIWHQDSDPKLFSSKKLLPPEKCKLIAWFCSYQLRIDLRQAAYVNALQNHIPVHIYGNCGNMTCKNIPEAPCVTTYSMTTNFTCRLKTPFVPITPVKSSTTIRLFYGGASMDGKIR